ncbi:hypothetical protein, partial [Nonomuraea sp. NPDC003214]
MFNKPPGWLYLTVFSAVAGVILYWASVPHWYVLEMFLVGLFFGLPLWVIWMIRFSMAISESPRVRWRLDLLRGSSPCQVSLPTPPSCAAE